MTKISTPSLRRVVVTGLGAISPIGNSIVDSWRVLTSNTQGGMTTLEEALTNHQGLSDEQLERELKVAKTLPCQVASPVKNLPSPNDRTSRFVQMALVAGAEAMEMSKLHQWLDTNLEKPIRWERQSRIGACIGSGMSGVRDVSDALHTVEDRGLRRLSPHFVPKVLANSAAGRLSLEYGLQ
eukprot:CAMPEP_0176138966 /NCGR_PEP_ID=MMETSP0120_2-20121206/70599_1 /TAXON_ID=160619 /ORGANISM="Kryptoperidinium foliaceum, Strain CCMP 1326" /LENGTH=181 /DNA_ID=CAMNT_0017474931 /DNA_START=72 /DNA_END=614 /DNA_ORIENTATION=-